jgi:DNA-binding response OmpR family regulator
MDDHAGQQPDAHPAMETRRHSVRVLIVEDTLELAEIIKAALRHMSVLVYHEARGQSALQTYHSVRPDLVLLDIGLPDMSGWKLLDAIKETQTENRRPVICVITAYGDPANRLMGKLQGVDEYLIKPFTLDDVRGVVQKVIDSLAAES